MNGCMNEWVGHVQEATLRAPGTKVTRTGVLSSRLIWGSALHPNGNSGRQKWHSEKELGGKIQLAGE